MIVKENLQEICFQTGYKILKDKGTALVGMSPGNGYFKKEAIHELIDFASNLFSRTIIFIPDRPAEHNYKAIGESHQKAERLARLKGNTLRNHTNNSIQNILSNQPNKNIKLLDWKQDIECNNSYIQQFEILYELYKNNNLFYQDTRDTSLQVIKSGIKENIDIEKALDEAVLFLIKELAFLLVSPDLFQVESFTYIYHKNWPVFENLIAGKYDGIVRKNIGYVIVIK